MRQRSTPAVNRKVIREATRFFSENEQAIADYAQLSGIVFEPGERWTIDVKSGRGTFDSVFFLKKGYTEAEYMWAVCHEIEHVRDWRKDPEAYATLFDKSEEERRIGLLYGYINDVMVNREVDRRFPAHRETRTYLYQVKLLPRVNYAKSPRHIQLITAMLREAIIPDEPLTLSSEVRSALNKLRHYDEQGTNLIELATDSTVLPRSRFLLVRDYIEPVYRDFFRMDLEERKNAQEKDQDQASVDQESAEGGPRSNEKGFVESNVAGDDLYFSDEYDEAETALPRGFSAEEARKAIEEAVESLRQEKTPEEIAKEQFRTQHDVSVEEAEDYAEEYKKIEHHITPLRDVFGGIVQMRKEIRRRLKERTDQGVILDPSMLAQAYIDVRNGVSGSRTQLKIRKDELDGQKLNEFEFTLVCDLSGSMNENWPGGKSYEQKLSTILMIEALDEFEKMLRQERLEQTLDLSIRSEVRGFHAVDEELKSLSDSITFNQRVRISQRLENCTGGKTADFKSLISIAAAMDDQTRMKIDLNHLRKIVIMITDGGSDDVSLTREARNLLTQGKVITKAVLIGRASKIESEKFKKVWEKDGMPCRNVSQLVDVIEGLLEELLGLANEC